MFEWPVSMGVGAAEHEADACEALARYFRERYPVMLDGSLTRADDRRYFSRHAKRTLRRGKVDADALPSAVLRETLESLAAEAKPSTKSGFTAIGPRHGRVWWDESVVDNLDDVLAGLDKPRLVLRFYDVSGLDPEGARWHDSFDVDVLLGEGGRTVQFWSGDRTYVVDLGYIHADGRFLRLARTNTADLPRDCPGDPDGDEKLARSRLGRRGKNSAGEIRPDAAAQEWCAGRADDEFRDLEAELVIHAVYRAFLSEGPRILRRLPELRRRDAAVLRREFFKRERERAGTVVARKTRSFIVTRLDVAAAVEVMAVKANDHNLSSMSMMMPVVAASGAVVDGSAERFGWLAEVLGFARSGVPPHETGRRRATAVRMEPGDHVLTPVALYHDGISLPLSVTSAPVFEVARHVRENLSETPVPVEAARVRDAHMDARRDDADAVRLFGGAEAKRMAKAGVRFTRMALTLEGRMRPGARLKVAGKLVHADDEGNFRLECVLSGRRASIPMRAGASVEGEARSLINVDWEKRPGRERRGVRQ